MFYWEKRCWVYNVLFIHVRFDFPSFKLQIMSFLTSGENQKRYVIILVCLILQLFPKNLNEQRCVLEKEAFL
jgi:hypothetical protein